MVLHISMVQSWLTTSKFPSVRNAFTVWPKYLRGGRGEMNFSFNYKTCSVAKLGMSWSRDTPALPGPVIWDP